MNSTKTKPGPRPRSCRTCQKRRKKRDLGRPSCERCFKSGYECLGYHDDQHNHYEMPVLGRLPPPSIPISATGSELLHSSIFDRASGQTPTSLTTSLAPDDGQRVDQSQSAASIFGSALAYRMTKLTPWNGDNQAMDNYNRSWPHCLLTTYDHTRTCQPLDTAQYLQTESSTRVGNIHTLTRALYAHIPSSVDATQVMREENLERIIHEHCPTRASYWLMSPPPLVSSALLAAPKSTIWALHLSAWLFQAVDGSMHSAMVSKCIDGPDKLEQEPSYEYLSDSSLKSTAGWLTTQVTVIFIKFATIGISSGYLALKKALPGLLRLVGIDSGLHIEHPRGDLVISFPRILCGSRYEFQWFVVYDTITSLLLGIPPLVEYGYDDSCDPASHSLEWAHAIPVALFEIISQVSSWRAGSRVASLDDWQELERRVLGWQSQPTATEDKAYVNNTVKLAIQEGWRHVTLIYIYMGMCGVSSHDERVQESISEIIRLGEAMDSLPIGVHILPHCVIVGLAAKYEKHRAIIHKKLLSFKGNRVWLFHRLEFGRVLEHLWRGVGAGGAPVTWDDYVESRRAMVLI